MGTPVVLVVENDVSYAPILSGLLGQAGYEAKWVSSGDEALSFLESDWADVVLTDLLMPRMDGLELLAKLQAEHSDLPVVMLSAHGTIRTAVEAMQRGAVDFIEIPADRCELLNVVQKAIAAGPRTEAQSLSTFSDLTDELAEVDRVATSRTTVLLLGETGTGKSRLAEWIHGRSPRRNGPFVVLDCGALPESVVDSELFGHVKGAFTGASRDRPGAARRAHGGTLFLDEIGDIIPAMQMKLLRLIQDKVVHPVGADAPVSVDIRVIAATKHDLGRRVREGRFRDDLYYRLAVVPVTLPPLRARPGAVRKLAAEIAQRVGSEEGRSPRLTDEALAALEAHSWPGNIRELENVVQRLVILTPYDVITARDVRARIQPVFAAGSGASPPATPRPDASRLGLDDQRRQAERTAIKEALNAAGGNRTRAARILGISRRTLYNKLQELDVLSWI